jgi:hypothetical protein
MTTNFTVISAATVPKNYTWDSGAPFETGFQSVPAFITTEYVSGYAPGVNVLFRNNSTTDAEIGSEGYFVQFDWDFGDYYNYQNNNVSLTCVVPVQHNFIMPGKYVVTLTQTAGFNNFVDPDPLLCRDKFNTNWYWDNLEFGRINAIIWDQTSCTPLPSAGTPYPKIWDSEIKCIQKYCKNWSWEQTRSIYDLETTWENTKFGKNFEKRWLTEINDTECTIPDAPFKSILETTRQTVFKTIVEVKELKPVANMYCVTRPIFGESPFTVQLTPRSSICGSFPIDRIDWDFNDGSPVKIVTRQGAGRDTSLIRNNIFVEDLNDPRNYDVIHTYTRASDQYAIFYPSITAYSANTGTQDSCCITIGPITLSENNQQTNILKTYNTDNGLIYAFNYNETCSFLTTNKNIKNIEQPKINLPQTTVRDSFGSLTRYDGNNGEQYPPYIKQVCFGEPGITFTYLLVEPGIWVESDQLIPSQSTYTGELTALVQENDGFIIVP